MPRKISSTWTFAVSPADLFDPGQIIAFDSHQVHLGQAALVLQATRFARSGFGRAPIIRALDQMVQHAAGYVVGPSFGVLEDIGRLQGRKGDMTGAYSLQRIGDDRFQAVGAGSSVEAAVEACVSGMARDLPEGVPALAVVAHARHPEAADALMRGVRERFPQCRVVRFDDRPSVAFFGGGSGAFALGFAPIIGPT